MSISKNISKDLVHRQGVYNEALIVGKPRASRITSACRYRKHNPPWMVNLLEGATGGQISSY